MNGVSGNPYQGWVIKLIILNVVVFVAQIITIPQQIVYTISGMDQQIAIPAMTYYLGLLPAAVVSKGYVWQAVTYMFLHSTTGFAHIFFNMYALLIFGVPIEQAWGGKKFLTYYMFCGIGAGLSIFAINLVSGGAGFWSPTIGASGAVFGLLLAFGMLYPNVEILLFFVLPIKSKYLVVLYGALELYLELFGGQSSISHVGHLGGLFFGLVYFYIFNRSQIRFKTKMFKANLGKRRDEYVTSVKTKISGVENEEKTHQIALLRKLRDGGLDSLTDDEVQYVRHKIIIGDDEENLCDDLDFDIDDAYCAGCENFNGCFVREAKKYVKN